ncbi:PREDICTED: WRKY transcription factor 1 [Populus euphratica]|uniref:WRKY transcription factor 1 n=1 Tax=Populus euphratica TaxID=75702 RepID=A0AAJ6VJK4_POPEU|nr:PREDICTED: WRKY transcription factor 1 [Populus euphratica]XP_011048958.1 PREDICTED: WRKY transcription factor 1 [Populus euphratica]XP_011048960.1 PREDICTED: WRKY transcription factor 1 [Populus euphratica]
MVSSEEVPDEVSPKELQKRQSLDDGTDTKPQTHDVGGHASQQEGIPASYAPAKSLENTGGRISELDKEGSVSSITPRKVSHTPGSDLRSLLSGQEGRTPIMREKVSEDGYRWRKYGQKLVRGNEFIRSYYKCTHPSCQVKKQLECSHDGKLADIVYIGEHEHPKPQHNLPQAVGCVLSIVEEKPDHLLLTGVEESNEPHPIESTNTSQISSVTSSEHVNRVQSEPKSIRDEVDVDDDQRTKRRKKSSCNDRSTPVDTPTSEPRLVIQTKSEVDIVSDGYRWRKYGQKLVKGNPNPRSYYRCSSPGCPVKKHVERASHDPKLVITSYEGQHDHDMPPSRTITHNTTGLNTCTTTIQNGELGTNSGESNAISLEMVAYNSSDSNIKLEEKLSFETRNKWKESNSGHESKSCEQQTGNTNATKVSGAANLDIVVNTSPVLAGRSTEQHDGESRIEPKENSAACGVHNITPGPESNPNEQHVLNSEPVQS